jgi:hypothetical protein
MDIAPCHCLGNMGAENSHREDPGRIENFLGNVGAHVSGEEPPLPLEGLRVFRWIFSDGAKTFEDCVRVLLLHGSCTPSLPRFHEMHEQLCFPLGTRQIHFPDIDLVAIVFYGRNLAFEDALQAHVAVPEVGFTTAAGR